MAMTEVDKQDFVNAYTKVLVTSWSSEEYHDRLKEDPRAALAEMGLTVPEGASLEVITTVPEDAAEDGGNGHLDRQLAQWEEGASTGNYRIYVPDTPRIDTAELNMSELEGVAGGDGAGDCGIGCCCCPCSCCT